MAFINGKEVLFSPVVNISDGEKVLIVTITDGLASHNAIQIVEYAEKGYAVYCDPYNDGKTRCALSRYCVDDEDNVYAKFAFACAEEGILYVWEIYGDGSIDFYEFISVSNGDFKSKIGDIDTALDSIIAIQNELIGGDSV